MKSIEEQIADMRKYYYEFVATHQVANTCVWFGELRPYRKSYLIRIQYRVPLLPEMVSILHIQPRVQILNPILEWHPEYEEGPIPHVYHNHENVKLPFLCLFDPDVPEWSVDDSIALTTLPWVERWIVNYEFWLATGRWSGGGRHVSGRNLAA